MRPLTSPLIILLFFFAINYNHNTLRRSIQRELKWKDVSTTVVWVLLLNIESFVANYILVAKLT